MALVLCTGIDQSLLATRRLILEQAGHTVVTAMDTKQVVDACSKHDFNVAVIGQTISRSEKRRLAHLVRQHCATTMILELYTAPAGKMIPGANAWLVVPVDVPPELARVVSDLAGESERRASAR